MEPLIEKLVSLARQEVGTRESGGNNRGLRIEDYQQATWLNPGPWPWCAAFTSWLLREWLEHEEVRKHLKINDPIHAQKWRCRDASAFGWEKWAQSKNLTLLNENSLARKGDFIVFDFSHIGLVMEDQPGPGAPVKTIEGNTNNAGTRDSESGDGVWEKIRHPSLIKSLIRVISN
jgi:hypothetical protein